MIEEKGSALNYLLSVKDGKIKMGLGIGGLNKYWAWQFWKHKISSNLEVEYWMYEGVTVKRITFNNLSVYLLLLVWEGEVK